MSFIIIHDDVAVRVKYHSTCKLYFNEETGGYISSGIAATDADGEILELIEDVSTDHHFVEKIIMKLNKNSVSLIHFKDIVLDLMEE